MRNISNTEGEPVRCDCGNLLARLVPGGVEIKCRRCKRTIVIPLEKIGGTDTCS
jgi:phage FluMu protein Com